MKYLLRSMLFVPAYKEKFLEKAITCEADAIIFDMEDGVPEGKREEARQVLRTYLERGVFQGRQLFLRVNELGSQDLQEDFKLVRGEWLNGIVAPKINGVPDIETFAGMLEECERREGIEIGTIKLLPLIETAEAVLNVQSIAGSNERVIALLFGGEDYLDSIWGQHQEPPKAFDVPRAMIAMAARMHHILPIDTPYLDLQNEEGFLAEERDSYAMGFAGALLVNPKQVPWANRCFRPSDEEVRHAQAIWQAVLQANREGASIATLNGKMIGPPMRKRAQKVIGLHELIQEKESLHDNG